MAGTVDYRVFTQGIPGGQISIMRNELVKNGFGHLFDSVIEQIQRVRTQVGGVALVTPTSEHVARQSILNAMNNLSETTNESPLWPGYSEMLRGVMGRPPMKMDVNLQKRALREYTANVIKNFENIDDSIKKEMNNNIETLVNYLWELSHPIQNILQIRDLEQRIQQLTDWDESRFSKEINESKKEIEELKAHVGDVGTLEDEYTNVLRKKPSDNMYNQILQNSGFEKFVSAGQITKEQFLSIVKGAAFCTVCHLIFVYCVFICIAFLCFFFCQIVFGTVTLKKKKIIKNCDFAKITQKGKKKIKYKKK